VTQSVMLGLDPSISGRRFSGLRSAPPENDAVAQPAARAIRQIAHCRRQAGSVMIVR
jgi:hypothetical protein